MKTLRIFLMVAMVLTVSGVNLLPQAANAYTPSLTSAAFLDADHNGAIDQIKVVFDSDVTACNFEAGDWTLTPGHVGLVGPTGRLNGSGVDAACDGSTNYFYLLVSGDTNETGYSGPYVPPDIQYKNLGTAGSVTVLGAPVPNQSIVTVDDTATPVLRSDGANAPTYSDSDHNGTVDRLKLVFTEPVNFVFNSSDWAWAAGSLTGFALSSYSSGGATSTIYLNVTANAGITGVGSGTAPTIRYAALGTGVVDLLGNSMAGMDVPQNISDGASPVIISTVPTAGSTGVAVTTSYVRVTFSEPMNTGVTSLSIGSGSWLSPSWSDANKTITRSRLATLAYDTNVTVTASGEDTNGYLVTSGVSPAVANPWSFRTVTDSSSAVSASESLVSASPTSVTANGSSVSVITVTVKNSSGSVLSGRTVTLSSNRGSTDTIAIVNGTTDSAGKAYFQVRSNTTGSAVFTAVADGTTISQTATVTFTSVTTSSVSASRSSIYATPSSVTANNSSYATVYVTVRDASDNLLSGKTVTLYSSRGGTDTISIVSGTTNSSGQATFQVKSGSTGTATLTAVADGTTISQTATVTFTSSSTSLIYGDLFKESGSTAVYYYADNGKRYVFPTSAIYFSWYSDFSTIKTVSHGTVTAVPFGGNVIVKPGAYLVQFVSMDTPFRVLDPKVYVLTSGGQLRWVTSASVAAAFYGADWERKIVAVPEVYKTNYGGAVAGADVNSVSDYSKVSVESTVRTISDLY
ncbi:MAG: invasin domain 3-containing protein [Patescibacteria group bacterium]